MSVPAVDVVVLTWNDPELASIAVRSVLGSEGVNARVVVVDNGSKTPFVWTASDPHVLVLRNEVNRGVAPGRAQGVRSTTAPVVCFLDSDAELGPRSLATLVARLQGQVGVVVPVFVGQAPEASAGRAPSLRVKAERALGLRADYDSVPRPDNAPAWPVEFGIGACQLFSRVAYDEVGGLDESIFYGPEDVEFCDRMRKGGFTIVQVADAEVLHPPRRAARRPLSRAGLRHGWQLTRYYVRRTLQPASGPSGV